MGGMIVNGINRGGQNPNALGLMNARGVQAGQQEWELPKPPVFDENDGLTGYMGKVNDFISRLLFADARTMSDISGAYMGGGGDINKAILNKTKIRAALGLMYTYLQELYQNIQEFMKSLKGTKDLGTT